MTSEATFEERKFEKSLMNGVSRVAILTRRFSTGAACSRGRVCRRLRGRDARSPHQIRHTHVAVVRGELPVHSGLLAPFTRR